MNEAQKRAAEKILEILERQRFADWYGAGGRLDSYIQSEYPKGDKRRVSKDDILNDVVHLFGIGDLGEIA